MERQTSKQSKQMEFQGSGETTWLSLQTNMQILGAHGLIRK